jgi:L-glyceraldehyde 3-phosphate reductase
MPQPYEPAPTRYDGMHYRRCGQSGVQLPRISLGLWYNFGAGDSQDAARAMILRAFDLGITHFDLANNYGPPPGSAEALFGRVLQRDLARWRDELIISTKAGWRMWPGPYGEWGSRKYLIASLDQSLKRMGLDYVDIFYSHRPDPDTPLEETMGALDFAVRSGRALYAGISSYSPAQTRQAGAILSRLGTRCLVHQPKYSMFVRDIEGGLLTAARETGMGIVVFSPLAQGLLTDKYLSGIPNDSRAAKPHESLTREHVSPAVVAKITQLNAIARARGQTLAQMALAWVLRHAEVTSAIVGASRVAHIEDAVKALDNLALSEAELGRIDAILVPR